MRIRVVGAGWYGCAIATGLLADGHEIEVHELADHIFAGASGGIPARLHLGAPHYPRSALTRAACNEHRVEFMARYGHLTRNVPVNLYAIAAQDSLVDFGTYLDVLKAGAVEFITVHDPAEFGLVNVEGAVLTGERHIVTRKARQHFEEALAGHVRFGVGIGDIDDPKWDRTIDCTFAALDNGNVDRYEPCVTVLLEGPTDRSVTIVDGQFPSLYVWDEEQDLSSLTSASLTPFSKTCRTYGEAKALLEGLTKAEIRVRCEALLAQIAEFWPAVGSLYGISEYRLSIRAMPRSASDTRLVDVARIGERTIRVRAGKIDAVVQAERIVKGMLC